MFRVALEPPTWGRGGGHSQGTCVRAAAAGGGGGCGNVFLRRRSGEMFRVITVVWGLVFLAESGRPGHCAIIVGTFSINTA